MRRVYLDQNAWVRLARVHNGLDTDVGGVAALKAVAESRRLGLASYPLSWIHYYETYRQRDPAKRRRLGKFMAQLSDFHSMIGAGDIRDHEVLAAIAQLRRQPAPSQPRIFGRGYAHAFGVQDVDLSREPYSSAVARAGVDSVRDLVELELLRGPDFALPGQGIEAPTRIGGERQLALEAEVERSLETHGRSGDLANRIVLAQETLELAEMIPGDLLPDGTTNSGVPKARKFLADFVLSLPAKGTITRMRMTGHQNPAFVWDLGDLNDMMALGMAAAYCDVVVAEKKWGDVLQRHRIHLRAQVITSVNELPRTLVALT